MKHPTIEVLKQALTSEERIVFAYLFGSHLQEEQSPLSDIDIAVYPDKKLDLDERLSIIQRLGKKTKSDKLDVTFLDRLSNLYLLEEIITNGQVLLDRDPDTRAYFEVMAHHRFLDFQFQRRIYMGE
ncbi:nucleotidyltransferase domain-containing protein [candidate division KSB1 bacterium]|nr:nucleotidyltransferase domain-containing protein [candidate division KSB1 bacterium]NIS23910.1 nucleotidyltransferase domain-containing protein [candidate division KSB1 bacterium]NIT70827.1 nucleotidyltransferase domain-containing protein [candidate division KSB1 bacterium]NIU24559.1 nucleotidyltransferase domain-containing protein [candidate division KSB1 bacterium]NIU94513.1 nucleotidyltransferase domain-containing protein [candidate division KSB1 bacterium]